MKMNETFEASRAKRLKMRLRGAHDRLDHAIMLGKPYESLERYSCYLVGQYGFLRRAATFYEHSQLVGRLPDLHHRVRLDQTVRDLADLGTMPNSYDLLSATEHASGLSTALGWIYVAEGFGLTATFLSADIANLGLGGTFGARYVTSAREERGYIWRAFTEALEGMQMTPSDEQCLVDAAEAAFHCATDLMHQAYRTSPGLRATA